MKISLLAMLSVLLLSCANTDENKCAYDNANTFDSISEKPAIKPQITPAIETIPNYKQWMVMVGGGCSGAAIASRLIITAGHCATNHSEYVYANNQEYKVLHYNNFGYVRSEKITGKTPDVAIYYIDRDLELKEYPKLDLTNDYDNVSVSALGRNKNKEYSWTLWQADGSMQYSFSNLFYATQNIDTVPGDSGGPVFLRDKSIIIGVITGGDDKTSIIAKLHPLSNQIQIYANQLDQNLNLSVINHNNCF